MKVIHLLTTGLALSLLCLAPANASAATAGQAPAIVGAPVGDADVPGDFNEDSNPDLLFQNMATGNLQVWLLTRTKPVARQPFEVPGNPEFVAVGTDDMDGDNRTDVLFWNASNSNLIIWYLEGTKLIRKSEIDLDLAGFTPVSVVDWNRDGNPDVVFQGKSGEILVVLLDRETVIGKIHVDLPQTGVDQLWTVLGSGDFDRDGDADLVLFRSALKTPYDTLAVALMDGNVGRIETITYVGDRNWQLRAVADFTRDGYPDFFWENYATGETGAWEMEGLKIKAQYVVTGPTTDARGWHIVGPR